MRTLLLATTNPAKLSRLRWLVEGLPFTLTTPADYPVAPAIAEDGATHQAIAEEKARAWSRVARGLALASDGGLAIPALGDAWDSRRTHRFAGERASDSDRAKRLLELMRQFAGDQRRAFWREALALADSGRLLQSWEVESQPGVIAEQFDPSLMEPGFWAFSLWYFPQFRKTYAQLSEQELAQVDDHWTRLRELVREWGERAKIHKL